MARSACKYHSRLDEGRATLPSAAPHKLIEATHNRGRQGTQTR